MSTRPEYRPTLEEARSLIGRGRTLPVFRRLLADHLTPVSAFARLAGSADHAFLLESVVGGENIARYSFVGARPACVLSVRRDAATLRWSDGAVETRGPLTDPLAELQSLLDSFRSVPHSAIPTGPAPLPRFTGGAVGYAGYDTIRYYERLPDAPTDDRNLNDLEFGIYDQMAIFDHVNKTVLVVAHARLDPPGFDAEYAATCRRIDAMVQVLNRAETGLAAEFNLDDRTLPDYQSTVTQLAFEQAVRKSIEYIRAGDIFQVVLSQRLRVETHADPFDIYRALRVVNPSPFMFYLKSPGNILVGASPEILCRVEDGIVTNRPLAGTRPRGATPGEDAALEKELLADAKDRAEHIMLVDLGRNDLGRVCEPGSVRLADVMSVERYSHVMHISSSVTGTLAKGRRALDALRTSLPVGTVSGAPKIRAMQIIDELEPVRRGPYGGAIGYLDLSGNMDTCIGLRTMVITPMPDRNWRIDVQAGAGIVADSDPASEYQETLNKARALLSAIRIAERRG